MITCELHMGSNNRLCGWLSNAITIMRSGLFDSSHAKFVCKMEDWFMGALATLCQLSALYRKCPEETGQGF